MPSKDPASPFIIDARTHDAHIDQGEECGPEWGQPVDLCEQDIEDRMVLMTVDIEDPRHSIAFLRLAQGGQVRLLVQVHEYASESLQALHVLVRKHIHLFTERSRLLH